MPWRQTIVCWEYPQQIFCLPSRRLEDVFQTYLHDVFRTCLQEVFSVTIFRLRRGLGRRKIVTLKACWRRLKDQQMFSGNVHKITKYTKYGEEACPRPFYKKSKLIKSPKCYTVRFYYMSLLLPCIKLYKALDLVSLHHFLHEFWRKIFLTLYSVNWPNFIDWLLLFLELLGSMCVVMCYPVCDVKNFEINICFIIKFFYMTKKSGQ